tara:strand:+ start:251 stop:838 length:588 start_codon:yes stop_codon:yes gene_type:complete
MKQELHFATPIYIENIGSLDFNNYLERHILKWQSEDKGIQKTNKNGWHSLDNMHTKKEYEPLIEDLYTAQKIIYEKENYELEPFLGNMWANINPPGSYNVPHIHPNSLWSGVYYIKTPKNCGSLTIEDPKSVGLMTSPKRKENSPGYSLRQIKYTPNAGTLIMFPSYLNHWVNTNESDDIRISVSFNFLQKGMFV